MRQEQRRLETIDVESIIDNGIYIVGAKTQGTSALNIKIVQKKSFGHLFGLPSVVNVVSS